ncbi:MAG: serine/threonine protein kinase [Myxococcaceae bacterium]|nr:serine/threonine protein kinase [Myxococcaceae bacterium]
MAEHLSTGVLHRLSLGLLATDELARSELHISECPQCRIALAGALKASQTGPESPRAHPPGPRAAGSATAAAGAWLPGTQLGAHQLLKEIARGGMGEIWLAIERGAGAFERLVVIKRVIASEEDDPLRASLFLDEARIAAQLHHPNIVQLFALGEHGGSHFLVMEYLPGQSLSRVASRLANQQALSLRVAVEIIIGAARGLGYAHRKRGLDGQPLNIVHRDVSPQNLLLTYDGQVKVLDFGIALVAGRPSRTATGLVRGKLAYMSPEQAAGNPLDARSDVFSLGVVLWELIAGRRLHPEIDEVAILKRLVVQTGPFLGLGEVVPGVDPALATLVSRALDRSPHARFADGAELAAALGDWLEGQPGPSDDLSAVMQRAFREEISALPQMHRALTVAPPVTPREAAAPSAVAAEARVPASPSPRPSRAWLAATAIVMASAGTAAVLLWRPSLPPPTDFAVPPTAAPTGAAGGDGPLDVTSAEPAEPVAPPPRPVVLDGGRTKSAARRGALTVESEPWTQVYWGKRLLGETPLVEIAMPAGHHRLRLKNDSEGIDIEVDIDIEPARTTAKRYQLK